jgi:hypothetical protein
VTNLAYTTYGWAIDDITIPELGFSDDVEVGVGDWDAVGFVRTSNVVPQEWAVWLVTVSDVPHAVPIAVGDDGKASATLMLAGDQRAALVIGAMAPATDSEAQYSFDITGGQTTSAELSTDLFSDDFHDPCKAGWTAMNTPFMLSGYEGEQFFMEMRQPWIYYVVTSQHSFEDVTVDVDATWDEPAGARAAGVTCYHYDNAHFARFMINSYGQYEIDLVNSGKAQPLKYWTWSAAINQGVGQTNHITATCQPDRLTLAVNGKQLASVALENYVYTKGDVGLAEGSSDVTDRRVLFDNLVVTTPK